MALKRILIVEDEAIVARDIREQLVALGYEPAGDTGLGEEALTLCEQVHPDLVLMDIHLAGQMDGIVAATAIRERFKLPVIFLTAFAEEDTLRRAKLAQPYGYIIKPFDERELRSTIEIALFKHAAEGEIQKASAFHESILRTSMDGMWVLDMQGRLVEVNPALGTMTGYSEEELLRMSVLDFDPVPLTQDLAARIDCVRENGLTRLERQHRRKDGRIIDVELSGVYLPYDGGRVICFLRDITEKKRQQRELLLKSAALDAAANAIVITSIDGTIEWANTAFTKLTGYELGEVIHRNPRELVKSGVQGKDFYQELWTTILAGQTWTGELVNRRKDGTHYSEEMMISPVKNATGQITHFIAIKQDITERKLLQEQFIKAQRLESLGMLAAGIAHDLNNMLAPIIFSGPLLRRSLTDEKDLKIVSMLESSAERGAALVKQVVAFAQGGSSGLRITQLKHVARDVVALAQNSFPKSIRVVSNIPTDAWPVLANPSQIHQVLLNLCVNARDAMPDGGTLTVGLSNRVFTIEDVATIPEAKPGNWLVLEVTDTGTGISPEVLPRIFDAFYTTKAPGKGTGLGLNTVRTVVQAHHGFIQVKTGLGQGTTMRITLPASTDPAAEESSAAHDLVKGNGELILLVDDDPNVRESLETVLVQSGYRVLPCADGVEAIVLYQSNSRQIDLVITDVDMPNLNGAVLAATLHQLKPDLRIIGISGLSSATHMALADAKRHVSTFLHKPFGAMDLLRSVHELLHPPA
jgi:two-component system cell cycle sensor histidine kinase/response regulator CckA